MSGNIPLRSIPLLLVLCVFAAHAQSNKKKNVKLEPQTAPTAEVSKGAFARAPSGPFKVFEALVSQMEDGQQLTTDLRFVAGETVFFSVSVDNYRIGANSRVELSAEIEAVDPAGALFMPKITDGIKTTLEEEDKEWKPKMRAQFVLPTLAHPGVYAIRYKVTDLATGQAVSGEKKLPVVGPDVAASDTLVVREFGFYRAEDEPVALTVAAYRPGDTLWARFFLTGFKYGPENAIDVTYDVTVVNAQGKQIFEQKDAAAERSKAFYPQPWVPGGLNLSLQKNMRVGTYGVIITGRDAIGKQTVSEKHEFRLE